MDPQVYQTSTNPSENNLFAKRNIISFLLVGILILSVPFAVSLVQKRQEIRSKATNEARLDFTGSGVKCDSNNNCTTTSASVSAQLSSPFGPPATVPSGTLTPTP